MDFYTSGLCNHLAASLQYNLLKGPRKLNRGKGKCFVHTHLWLCRISQGCQPWGVALMVACSKGPEQHYILKCWNVCFMVTSTSWLHHVNSYGVSVLVLCILFFFVMSLGSHWTPKPCEVPLGMIPKLGGGMYKNLPFCTIY